MSGIVGGDLDRERRAVMNSLYDLETEFETPTGTRSPSGASSPVSFDNGDDSQIAQHRTLLAALGCLSQILRVSFVQVSSTSEAPLSMEDAQEAAAQVAALMYNESLSVDIQYAALDVLAQFVSLQNGEVPDSILLPMIEAASAPLRLCVRAVHPDFQSGGTVPLPFSLYSDHCLISDFVCRIPVWISYSSGTVDVQPSIVDPIVALCAFDHRLKHYCTFAVRCSHLAARCISAAIRL
jgi:hypothetical protein